MMGQRPRCNQRYRQAHGQAKGRGIGHVPNQ
jgi:hypothetical protein